MDMEDWKFNADMCTLLQRKQYHLYKSQMIEDIKILMRDKYHANPDKYYIVFKDEVKK